MDEDRESRLRKTQENREKQKSLIRSLVGQRVVLQEKGGVVIAGLLSEYDGGYLRLVDVSVTGRRYKAKPPFVLAHVSVIAHIHPEVPVEARQLVDEAKAGEVRR